MTDQFTNERQFQSSNALFPLRSIHRETAIDNVRLLRKTSSVKMSLPPTVGLPHATPSLLFPLLILLSVGSLKLLQASTTPSVLTDSWPLEPISVTGYVKIILPLTAFQLSILIQVYPYDLSHPVCTRRRRTTF